MRGRSSPRGFARWRTQPAVNAKPAEPKLEFEVASVKASAPPAGNGTIRLGQQGGPGSSNPGRVTYAFSTIRDLMVDAYGIGRSQITGGPNWLHSERFDIVAKAPAGATKEQVKVMLQNLLAERFKLTLHHENKELSMYALVVGAKGHKLKDSASLTLLPPPMRELAASPAKYPRYEDWARWLPRDSAGRQRSRRVHDDDDA